VSAFLKGLVIGADFDRAAMLVTGVFVGSAAWWLLLSSGTAMLRSKFSDASMRLVNDVSGSIIVAFGIYAITTAFRI
jgi:arginine exporter protein ArgO